MKRKILFRGLYKNVIVYGNLIKRKDEGVTDYLIEKSDSYDFSQWEVNPESIGQYTGIKDKNGIKIFEGDIITTPYTFGDEQHEAKGVVTYLAPYFKSVGIEDYFGGHYPIQSNSEVIGNIL